jgi:hypothetical protein
MKVINLDRLSNGWQFWKNSGYQCPEVSRDNLIRRMREASAQHGPELAVVSADQQGVQKWLGGNGIKVNVAPNAAPDSQELWEDNTISFDPETGELYLTSDMGDGTMRRVKFTPTEIAIARQFGNEPEQVYTRAYSDTIAFQDGDEEALPPPPAEKGATVDEAMKAEVSRINDIPTLNGLAKPLNEEIFKSRRRSGTRINPQIEKQRDAIYERILVLIGKKDKNGLEADIAKMEIGDDEDENFKTMHENFKNASSTEQAHREFYKIQAYVPRLKEYFKWKGEVEVALKDGKIFQEEADVLVGGMVESRKKGFPAEQWYALKAQAEAVTKRKISTVVTKDDWERLDDKGKLDVYLSGTRIPGVDVDSWGLNKILEKPEGTPLPSGGTTPDDAIPELAVNVPLIPEWAKPAVKDVLNKATPAQRGAAYASLKTSIDTTEELTKDKGIPNDLMAPILAKVHDGKTDEVNDILKKYEKISGAEKALKEEREAAAREAPKTVTEAVTKAATPEGVSAEEKLRESEKAGKLERLTKEEERLASAKERLSVADQIISRASAEEIIASERAIIDLMTKMREVKKLVDRLGKMPGGSTAAWQQAKETLERLRGADLWTPLMLAIVQKRKLEKEIKQVAAAPAGREKIKKDMALIEKRLKEDRPQDVARRKKAETADPNDAVELAKNKQFLDAANKQFLDAAITAAGKDMLQSYDVINARDILLAKMANGEIDLNGAIAGLKPVIEWVKNKQAGLSQGPPPSMEQPQGGTPGKAVAANAPAQATLVKLANDSGYAGSKEVSDALNVLRAKLNAKKITPSDAQAKLNEAIEWTKNRATGYRTGPPPVIT